jgi:cytochrome c5
MIFLLIFAMTAMADEPEDKSADIYRSYCTSCHGERAEKIPLKQESTAEQRLDAINVGVSNMPPYNWLLGEGEIERLIKYMEGL